MQGDRQEGSHTLAVLDVEALATLLRAQVRHAMDQQAAGPASPWLTVDEAAEYMRCPASRVRKMTSARVIPVHYEGRRVLYRRDELDAFIKAGGWSG